MGVGSEGAGDPVEFDFVDGDADERLECVVVGLLGRVWVGRGLETLLECGLEAIRCTVMAACAQSGCPPPISRETNEAVGYSYATDWSGWSVQLLRRMRNLRGAMPRRPTGLPKVVVEIAVWIGEITGIVEREKFPADVPDGRWSGEACVGESLLCKFEVGELAFIVSVI